MDIIIRSEEVNDYRRVEELAREAFWNVYFPGAHEHYIVHTMRDHPDLIRELVFVIEVDGRVEGAIFYTRSKIVGDDTCDTISFGPVFISHEFHRNGLGRQLITHSIEVAKTAGHRAILTLGSPDYYGLYGFKGGKTYGISMPDGRFYKGLLVLPLYEGALDGISGHAVFSDVFEVNEADVDAFDESFPPKEKKRQASQEEYEKMATMLDES